MTNSIELLTAAKEEKAARLARSDFWRFRLMMHKRLKVGWWQKEVSYQLQKFYDDFQNGLRPQLVIQAPPQHGKSVIINDFLLWIIGKDSEKKESELKIIYAAFSDALSTRANRRIKRFTATKTYSAIFPRYQQTFPTNQDLISFGSDGYFRNTTTGGAITGESMDCITKGTLIATNKGLVAVENLNINNLILTFNNGVLSYEWLCNITHTVSHEIYRVTTESGRILECTGDHGIFTKHKGYVEANELSVGDNVVCIWQENIHENWYYDTIRNIEKISDEAITYDITVANNHNFFANGILVHNCGIIDDPVKGRESANSATVREKTWDWFTSDFKTRFSDNGAFLCILTRWHVDDVIGRLLETDNTVKSLLYPAIAEHDEQNRKAGDALFPEHKSIEFLKGVKRVMPAATWESLYQQHPTIKEGNFFKPDLISLTDAVPSNLQIVRAWDFAATANGGDYTVGVKLGYDKETQLAYVLDVVRGQFAPEEVELILKNTADKDGHSVKILLPQDPGQAGKSQAKSFVKLLSGYSVLVSTVSGDKETRASPVAAQANVGNLLMIRAGWNREFIEELRNFPNGKNDDQVDALSDCYNHFVGKKSGWF